MDKMDKIGADGVRKEFEERGLAGQTAQDLAALLGTARIGRLGELAERLDEEGKAAIAELRQLFDLTAHTSAGPHVELDAYLARGLSYYTGPIFEIQVPDLAGSLGGGGRYDNLIGMFSGENIPASGISLGLERILVVMGERKMFPEHVVSTPADVMVVQWFANRTPLYLDFATELRKAGLRVELYPDSPAEDGRKIGDRQFKYAAARGIPFVAVIGADEFANRTVTVKNMKTGEQTSIARPEVAKWLNS
jgi:histidyl-tRNA synthetase